MVASEGALPPRYELRGALGAGGMGEVLRAFDRDRGHEVALKLQRVGDAAAGFLFEQEFWALKQLAHPGLVAAYELGRLADGTAYFTMELVAGADLAVDAPADPAGVRAWLPAVLGALGHLHGRGWRHGDLKPGNIRVLPDGTGKLMDLGLLARVGRSDGAVRGTLAYLAPEVAGAGAADGRADLYALGAVLHHALAGRPPFAGSEPLALLKAHVAGVPEALPADVPADLAAVVRRLLAKAPGERFALAADVAAALGLAADDAPAGLLGAPLVGRDAELGGLAGAPGTVRVVGPAGAGKTRLLDEARAVLRLTGGIALAATGLGAEAAPYAALRGWLPELAARAPEAARRLGPVLARVAPELGPEPAAALDGLAERLRLHAAVGELAAEALPGAAAWFVDGADRLDPASLALLEHLMAVPGTAWAFVLSSEAPESSAPAGDAGAVGGAKPLFPPMRGADAGTVVALSPLPVDPLAQALLGQPEVPAVILAALEALADGRPGHVEALLAHWLRTGALRRAAGRWDLAAGADLAPPGGLDGLQDLAVAALGPDAGLVAAAAGLLGGGELAWLAATADLPADRFHVALDALVGADVLTRDGARFALRRPAEAARLAASVDGTTLHGRAAAWASAQGGSPETAPLAWALAAAHHHLRSAEPRNGFAWTCAAARGALAVFAAASAEPLLARARALPDLTPSDRLTLDLLAAETARWLGRPDEALAIFEAGILPALAGDPGGARARATYAALLQQKGRYAEAKQAFADAAEASLNVADEAGAARATFFGARVAYFAGEATEAKALMAEAESLGREAAPPALLAAILSFAGYLAHDEALLHEAVALAEGAGSPYNLYEALNNRGNFLLQAERYTEAGADFAACVDLCARMGSPGERVFAQLNLGIVYLERGALADAQRELVAARDLAAAQGRMYPEGFALGYLGLARVRSGATAQGLADFDRAAALAAEIGNQPLAVGVAVCRAEAMVHLGRLDEAREALAAAGTSEEHAAKLRRLEAAIAAAPPPGGITRDRLFTLAELAVRAAAQPDLDAVLLESVQALVALAGADRGFLLLYDDLLLTHRVVVGSEADAHSTSLAHQVLGTGRPVFVEDAQADAALAAQASVQALALRSAVGVPLIAGGETIGVMLADSQRVNTRFGPADLDVAEALGMHVASIIAAARRHDVVRAEGARQASIAETARRALRAPDRAAQHAIIAAAACRAVGAERALWLAGPDLACRAAWDATGAPLATDQPFSVSLAAWTRQAGQPVALVDADEPPAGFTPGQSIAALNLRAVAAVPLPDGGVLYVDSRRLDEAPADGLKLLEGLAALLA